MSGHGDDLTPERDPAAARRELRIERAVVGAVLHGYGRDNWGFNDAMTDLMLREKAQILEILPALWWALSRLPRGMEEPDQLQARLVDLYGVSGGD
ncbi:hypothetical protein [Nocardia sp. NPDC051981]|uniref:hypothetical protein n=1 Tax=Nocardia sp. NPDC051981 TaxID=3155417 RepID=UPI0034225F44